MDKKLQIAFALLAFARLALADDVFWVKLDTRINYRDIELTCSDQTHPIRTLYLVGRLDDNGKLLTAELRDGNDYFLSRAVFSDTEREGIVVEKDVVGDFWVKRLPLTARLMAWVIFNVDHADASLLGCKPPKDLASIQPEKGDFVFTQKDADEYFSPKREFTGKRVDGKFYSVKLGFSQTLFMTP